jgi:threonine dehydrogenase-like Zn-dependent dehydrogenase
MKALIWTEQRALCLADRPRPTVDRPDDVLIRVAQTGICGTDRSVLLGKFDARPGVVMGHESVGVVAEKGSAVTTLEVGQRIVVNPTLHCGTCVACLRGRVNFCANKAGTEVGVDRDGAFADYVLLPARFCHALPPEMTFDRAVGIEPLACALHNIESARVAAGETVVVVGGGPVGAVCAFAAERCGAEVVVVEPDPFRRNECSRIFGDRGPRIRVRAPGDADVCRRGDVVIDTVGNLLAECLDYASQAARVVVMGYDSRATATIRPLEILQRGLSIIGAGDYDSHLFPRAIDLARGLPLERIITHRFSLIDFAEAFGRLSATPHEPYRALKVLIVPEPR